MNAHPCMWAYMMKDLYLKCVKFPFITEYRLAIEIVQESLFFRVDGTKKRVESLASRSNDCLHALKN